MTKSQATAALKAHLVSPISIYLHQEAAGQAIWASPATSCGGFEDEVFINNTMDGYELFGLGVLRGADYEFLEDTFSAYEDRHEIDTAALELLAKIDNGEISDAHTIAAVNTLADFNSALVNFVEAHKNESQKRFTIEPLNAEEAEKSAGKITDLLVMLEKREIELWMGRLAA